MTIHSRVKIALRDNATGEFVTFDDIEGADEDHFAIVFPTKKRHPEGKLVRVHSECATGDLFGSQMCDCGPQLSDAFNRFAKAGGILIYLRQEGRGIGLKAKLDAYKLQQERGVDTFQANEMLGHGRDQRSYLVAAQMLKDLGETRIRLLSNNPDKAKQLIENGIDVTEVVRTGVHATAYNIGYLQAKRQEGHLLPALMSLKKDK